MKKFNFIEESSHSFIDNSLLEYLGDVYNEKKAFIISLDVIKSDLFKINLPKDLKYILIEKILIFISLVNTNDNDEDEDIDFIREILSSSKELSDLEIDLAIEEIIKFNLLSKIFSTIKDTIKNHNKETISELYFIGWREEKDSPRFYNSLDILVLSV